MADPSLMEKIVSLCKRRGFVFPGVWDYGQLGSILKRNIENLWLNRFVYSRGDMFLLDSSIIMPETVWQASGHLEGFADPMVECMKCKHRFRVDKLEDKTKCPDCGGAFGEEKMFNLLFPVSMGAAAGGATTGYLRGEIAQGMFVNFKNVLDSAHPRLPFGIAQSGKAFRNEIAPRNFLFRVREFDLMEFEYFIREKEWEEQFEYWRKEMHAWISDVGIDASAVHEIDIAPEDRAHYSKRTIDFYFDFPFGRDELYGLAYRTDYDLSRHTEKSGVDLSYLDEETGERFIPHVIEPTFGLGRTVLAVLASAYREDTMSEEMRTYLALAPKIAPVKAMVSPLLKNKPELVVKAREVR
ncbi:MAG: Glycine-tRNA ligase, partial [Parcubacteria group bacterium GW2011_GWB1_55_9]